MKVVCNNVLRGLELGKTYEAETSANGGKIWIRNEFGDRCQYSKSDFIDLRAQKRNTVSPKSKRFKTIKESRWICVDWNGCEWMFSVEPVYSSLKGQFNCRNNESECWMMPKGTFKKMVGVNPIFGKSIVKFDMCI